MSTLTKTLRMMKNPMTELMAKVSVVFHSDICIELNCVD